MKRYTPSSLWPRQLVCECGFHSTTIDRLIAHRKSDEHLRVRLALGQISLNDYNLEKAIRSGRVPAGV